MITIFTVELIDRYNSSQLTMATEETPIPGLQGSIGRLVTPGLLWVELHLLAKCVEEKS